MKRSLTSPDSGISAHSDESRETDQRASCDDPPTESSAEIDTHPDSLPGTAESMWIGRATVAYPQNVRPHDRLARLLLDEFADITPCIRFGDGLVELRHIASGRTDEERRVLCAQAARQLLNFLSLPEKALKQHSLRMVVVPGEAGPAGLKLV